MLLKCYSIYDCKGLIFHAPFTAVSDGAASRMFSDLANDAQTTIGRHPKDYALWSVGTWEDNSGLFTPQVPPVHLVEAVALVHTQPDMFKGA